MKNLLGVLVTAILLGACASPISTPIAIDPLPTPSIGYQLVGNTKNTFMVVVNPADNANRAGLQQIGDYLCSSFGRCFVWFWDDISKADTQYPVDVDKEQTLIATYEFDFLEYKSVLKVFTLGDER